MSLLQSGVDTTVIALWLGHAGVRSTDAYVAPPDGTCAQLPFQEVGFMDVLHERCAALGGRTAALRPPGHAGTRTTRTRRPATRSRSLRGSWLSAIRRADCAPSIEVPPRQCQEIEPNHPSCLSHRSHTSDACGSGCGDAIGNRGAHTAHRPSQRSPRTLRLLCGDRMDGRYRLRADDAGGFPGAVTLLHELEVCGPLGDQPAAPGASVLPESRSPSRHLSWGVTTTTRTEGSAGALRGRGKPRHVREARAPVRHVPPVPVDRPAFVGELFEFRRLPTPVG